MAPGGVSTGTQFGPYVILGELGAGGMGQVWKASDTRLDRVVAIKVLPTELSQDLKSRQRFLLEAQAAASLNHENVCTIYEVDTERWLLVMELIDGETVRDIIGRGPLPLRQALDVAIQAAGGVAAAHQKGIVHRDMKPGNLMVTRHGRVKVMDFGLARSDDRTQITGTGVKLGTPAYMSPEQVRGELVDRRADIWALGVVLFECIAGRRAFPGETPEAMLHAIVHSEPEPLTALRSGVPLELERIVRKAMAKPPDERYQHVDDLLVDLRAVSSSLSQTGSSGLVGGTQAEVRRLRKQRTALLAAMALFVPAGLFGYLMLRRTEPVATAVQFSVDPPDGTTFGIGGSGITLSPNGKRLAFFVVGADGVPRIAVRSFDTSRSRVLAGTESPTALFWSADGSRVGYGQAGMLKTLPADGGTPVTVCDWTGGLYGDATWSQHGIILFSGGTSGELMKVNAAGGRPEAAMKLDDSRGEIAHLNPIFLPDGKRFLYRSRTKDGTGIFVGDLDSVERRFIVSSNSPPQYSTRPNAPAYLLFAQNLSLYAYRFDLRAARTQGDPIRILPDDLIHTTAYSADQNGTLAYRIGGEQRSRLTITDRKGDAVREIGPAGDYRQVRVASDGRKAVAARVPPGGGSSDISIIDISSGASTRLTFSDYYNWSPTLSPDQSSVYFVTNRTGEGELIRISTSRPSTERSGVTQLSVRGGYDLSPDDRFLIVTRGSDFWMLARDRPERLTPLTNTPADEYQAAFSPTSRYFAYTSNESGEAQVYVGELAPAFDGIVNRWQVSIAGGSHPRWHRSGKELFYIARDKKLMSVPVVLAPAFAHSPPRPLFATKLPLISFLSPYDVVGDNFLLNIPVEDPAAARVIVTLNWRPDSQR